VSNGIFDIMRRYRHRASRGEKQRIAVGVGLSHIAAAERAVGAGLVVNVDPLAKELGHFVGYHAADEVGRTARRKRHHDADGPGRKILRIGARRLTQRQDCTGGERRAE
jgi:hypothetical protein